MVARVSLNISSYTKVKGYSNLENADEDEEGWKVVRPKGKQKVGTSGFVKQSKTWSNIDRG